MLAHTYQHTGVGEVKVLFCHSLVPVNELHNLGVRREELDCLPHLLRFLVGHACHQQVWSRYHGTHSPTEDHKTAAAAQ